MKASMLTAAAALAAVTLSLAFAAGNRARGQAPAPKASPAAVPGGRIRDLRLQRREIFRQLEDILKEGRVNGTVTYEQLLPASRRTLEADLELAQTREERVAVLQKIVANARQREEIALDRHRSGVTSAEERLETQAARLEAEIRLEQEKGAAAPGP